MDRWVTWLLVAWVALSILVTIAGVGRARQPITPAAAVGSLIVGTAMILGVLYLGGVL